MSSTKNPSPLNVLDESSERGVQNPKIIDLIQLNSEKIVEFIMIEPRDWQSLDIQLEQLAEKFNNYLDYILDGFFTNDYPQYEQYPVCIVLECAHQPPDSIGIKLSQLETYCKANSITFELRSLSSHR